MRRHKLYFILHAFSERNLPLLPTRQRERDVGQIIESKNKFPGWTHIICHSKHPVLPSFVFNRLISMIGSEYLYALPKIYDKTKYLFAIVMCLVGSAAFVIESYLWQLAHSLAERICEKWFVKSRCAQIKHFIVCANSSSASLHWRFATFYLVEA